MISWYMYISQHVSYPSSMLINTLIHVKTDANPTMNAWISQIFGSSGAECYNHDPEHRRKFVGTPGSSQTWGEDEIMGQLCFTSFYYRMFNMSMDVYKKKSGDITNIYQSFNHFFLRTERTWICLTNKQGDNNGDHNTSTGVNTRWCPILGI